MKKFYFLLFLIFILLSTSKDSKAYTMRDGFVIPDYMMTDEYIAQYGVPFAPCVGYAWGLDGQVWYFNPPRLPDGSIDYKLLSDYDIYHIYTLPQYLLISEPEPEPESSIKPWSSDSEKPPSKTKKIKKKRKKKVKRCKYCGKIKGHKKHCGHKYHTDFVI